MNKVSGKKADFSLLTEDKSRIIIGYMFTELDEDMCEWYEVYIPKKEKSYINFDEVKNAILNDINSRTDQKILNGFVWDDTNIWLSTENQFNFKAAYDLAIQTQGQSLPVTFKVGEDSEGYPIYHTFTNMEDFTNFYTQAIQFVNQCLVEGWQEKDSIDWTLYEELFNNNQI